MFFLVVFIGVGYDDSVGDDIGIVGYYDVVFVGI